MLKPYLDRESVPLSPVRDGGQTVLALSSAELIDEAQAAVVLSSADPSETPAASALTDVELVEDVVGPSRAVVLGRQKKVRVWTGYGDVLRQSCRSGASPNSLTILTKTSL